MLLNEKIVRQIVRQEILKEANKKLNKINLMSEAVKFKQDPDYAKGKSKFLLVPGSSKKKKEFTKLSKTIRDHLGGIMGVTGNPNFKTAISNISNDAKVDKIISDIAAGKNAGSKAGIFKKYSEYIKGQSGEIPTNLKRYVEEYVDQIETKIEDGEKDKDNIIKASEQYAITTVDKEALKRSNQPKKKKEKKEPLSNNPKNISSAFKADPSELTVIKSLADKGTDGYDKKKLSNLKKILGGMKKSAPDKYKEAISIPSVKKAYQAAGGKVEAGIDKKDSGEAAAKSDEKVYRLKGEISKSNPDKFWGYYTLIDGNWNYIQKKKGGWKPEDGRDKGQWKPVKGQKAVNKLNGGTLIDVSTNNPESKDIKGKADPDAKKKRASNTTNSTKKPPGNKGKATPKKPASPPKPAESFTTSKLFGSPPVKYDITFSGKLEDVKNRKIVKVTVSPFKAGKGENEKTFKSFTFSANDKGTNRKYFDYYKKHFSDPMGFGSTLDIPQDESKLIDFALYYDKEIQKSTVDKKQAVEMKAAYTRQKTRDGKIRWFKYGSNEQLSIEIAKELETKHKAKAYLKKIGFTNALINNPPDKQLVEKGPNGGTHLGAYTLKALVTGYLSNPSGKDPNDKDTYKNFMDRLIKLLKSEKKFKGINKKLYLS